MTEDELIATYPRLWHMAHKGAWPAIRDNGLMSVKALLDDYGIEGDQRTKLGSCRRPESVHISATGKPGAVLRDQKPMSDSALSKCLEHGLSPTQWYELLNSRSFFWLSRSRVWTLLKARAYKNVPQTVLTIDTAGLVSANSDRVWLSPINSGSTLFKPQPRGLNTFKRVNDFPFKERSKRATENNVVELVVDYSVPDVASHVLAVHEVQDDKIVSEIWRNSSAKEDDHP